MIYQLTTKRDLIAAFANAMNLISPNVENHHEQVAYLSWQLAVECGMDERHQMMAFYGGLLHDIGGILRQGEISLQELELNSREVANAGAALLKMFPMTKPFAQAVNDCQTPWERLRGFHQKLWTPLQISQIIHLADAVSLLLNSEEPVLNQVKNIQMMIHTGENAEFSSEVLTAFDRLCGRESVWLEVMYRPQAFLDAIYDNRWVSLDEAMKMTEFMSKIIDFRSPFTAMHSAGVSATATALAELAGMSDDECGLMRIAGYLHDIGKLKISNDILEKPGKLTDEEFNVMKEHVYYTWVILKDVKGFEQIAPWAAFHHEKLNGNGYPFHLKESELSLGSRIMTVADIFTALSEDRPYRKQMDKEKVLSIIRGDAERGLLSPRVVDLLEENYEMINEKRDVVSKAASKKYQESLREQSEE